MIPGAPLAEARTDLAIVGGGISGLSLAWYLHTGHPEISVQVLEGASEVGGTMRTIDRDGFRIEVGPNGFLDRAPHTIDLASSCGFQEDLLTSSDAARRRLLFWKGRLHHLPESPRAFLRTGLLSGLAKARVLCEPTIRRGDPEADESVASFVRRRLGKEILDVFVDAFVSGIFAGDPERLSLRAAFPRLHELENEHGSLIRASMRIARAKKNAPTAQPSGTLRTFRAGMGTLPRHLAGRLGPECVKTKARVSRLARQAGGWGIEAGDGRLLQARQVVLALPAPASAALLRDIAPGAAAPLSEIPYASVAVVALGFRRADVTHPMDAFGWLCPEAAGRPILGCLFSSSIYPGEVRAPRDHVLIRVLLGGARHPDRAQSAGPCLQTALNEVRPVLGIKSAPVCSEVVRHGQAIPQYTLGHLERVAHATAALTEDAPGLWLHGNAFGGISVNDCARTSVDLASQIATSLHSPRDS